MLMKNDPDLLDAACGIYSAAYGETPWNEAFDPAALKDYLRAYIERDGLIMYVFFDENTPCGTALCSIIPAIGSDFARIEDFCIAPTHQRKGVGSRFMAMLCADLRAAGCDSVLLATQRDYASHRFYLKNGFSPLDSSVQLFREI